MTGSSESAEPEPISPAGQPEQAEQPGPAWPAGSAGQAWPAKPADDWWDGRTAGSAPPGPLFAWSSDLEEPEGEPPPGQRFTPPPLAPAGPPPGPALASPEPWGAPPPGPPAQGVPPGPSFSWEQRLEESGGPSDDLREPWYKRLGRRRGPRR
jgi:hypothetical protein